MGFSSISMICLIASCAIVRISLSKGASEPEPRSLVSISTSPPYVIGNSLRSAMRYSCSNSYHFIIKTKSRKTAHNEKRKLRKLRHRIEFEQFYDTDGRVFSVKRGFLLVHSRLRPGCGGWPSEQYLSLQRQ